MAQKKEQIPKTSAYPKGLGSVNPLPKFLEKSRWNWVLVDGPGLFNQSFYSQDPVVTDKDRLWTGGVFGLSFYLREMTESIRPRKSQKRWKTIWFWDSPPPRLRSQLTETYKEHRHKDEEWLIQGREMTPEAWRHSLLAAQSFIHALGIRQLWARGLEAEDLLAAHVKKILREQPHAKILVVSRDHDLFQTLRNERVGVWRRGLNYLPDKPKWEVVWTRDYFRWTRGFDPINYDLFLALKGDKTDDIHGVKGLGPVTSQKIMILAQEEFGAGRIKHDQFREWLFDSQDERLSSILSERYLQIINEPEASQEFQRSWLLSRFYFNKALKRQSQIEGLWSAKKLARRLGLLSEEALWRGSRKALRGWFQDKGEIIDDKQ